MNQASVTPTPPNHLPYEPGEKIISQESGNSKLNKSPGHWEDMINRLQQRWFRLSDRSCFYIQAGVGSAVMGKPSTMVLSWDVGCFI